MFLPRGTCNTQPVVVGSDILNIVLDNIYVRIKVCNWLKIYSASQALTQYCRHTLSDIWLFYPTSQQIKQFVQFYRSTFVSQCKILLKTPRIHLPVKSFKQKEKTGTSSPKRLFSSGYDSQVLFGHADIPNQQKITPHLCFARRFETEQVRLSAHQLWPRATRQNFLKTIRQYHFFICGYRPYCDYMWLQATIR